MRFREKLRHATQWLIGRHPSQAVVKSDMQSPLMAVWMAPAKLASLGYILARLSVPYMQQKDILVALGLLLLELGLVVGVPTLLVAGIPALILGHAPAWWGLYAVACACFAIEEISQAAPAFSPNHEDVANLRPLDEICQNVQQYAQELAEDLGEPTLHSSQLIGLLREDIVGLERRLKAISTQPCAITVRPTRNVQEWLDTQRKDYLGVLAYVDQLLAQQAERQARELAIEQRMAQMRELRIKLEHPLRIPLENE